MRSYIMLGLAAFAAAKEVIIVVPGGKDDSNDGEKTDGSSGHVETCWNNVYGRGAGKAPDECPEGLVLSQGRCYPPCEDDYTGYGQICRQNCPDGYRDDGLYCYKLTKAYGRGVGQASQCENCQKWGALWYPECKEGYHNVACCICSYDCPAGMTDIGISCAKGKINRGYGEPEICASDMQEEKGLCYDQCPPQEPNGDGPTCYASCPEGTYQCGKLLCLTPDQSCHDYIDSVIETVIGQVKAIATGQKGNIDLTKLVEEFTFPMCPLAQP